MKEIGIGVIGTGFMGKAHSIAYSASASVFGTGLRPHLEMVCDLSPERAQVRAADLGFSRYSSDWREVVNDPAVELISVCTPNDTHAEISIAALAAGKHVWCEKPMSTTLLTRFEWRKVALLVALDAPKLYPCIPQRTIKPETREAVCSQTDVMVC